MHKLRIAAVAVTCAFCSLEAHGPCSWPVEKFYPTTYGELELGDIVRRIRPYRTDAFTVATVEKLQHILGGWIRVGLMIRRNKGKSKPKAFDVLPDSPVRALRLVPCGALCCEQHHVARGPGIYHCQDHWQAWQAVA